MTVRFLKAWNGFCEQQIVSTLSLTEETRLIGLGFCTKDLDGDATGGSLVTSTLDASGNPNGVQANGVNLPINRKTNIVQNYKQARYNNFIANAIYATTISVAISTSLSGSTPNNYLMTAGNSGDPAGGNQFSSFTFTDRAFVGSFGTGVTFYNASVTSGGNAPSNGLKNIVFGAAKFISESKLVSLGFYVGGNSTNAVSVFIKEDGTTRRLGNYTGMPATVTLTAAPTAVASGTGVTLTGAFTGLTGTYKVSFAAGAVRYLLLTNGSTAASWQGGPAVTDASAVITLNEIVFFGGTAGNNYLLLTFATNKKREFWLTTNSGTMLVCAAVPNTYRIEPAPKGLSATVFADSLGTSTGAAVGFNNHALAMAAGLGYEDINPSGVGGQGYSQVAGGYSLVTRIPLDITFRDAYFLAMLANNATGDATLPASILSCVNQCLAVNPNADVFVLGAYGGNSAQANALTVEAIIQAQIASLGNPKVVFIPWTPTLATSILFGTGKTGTPTGTGNADLYIGGTDGADGTHWNDDGHIYVGLSEADRVANVISKLPA